MPAFEINSDREGWRQPVRYRRLNGYRYLLAETFTIRVEVFPRRIIEHPFLSLSLGGLLTIQRGYAWDGASGPALNTPSFVRGSLVHDALYQLLREELLDGPGVRATADAILRDLCRLDGMHPLRAWWVWLAVRVCARGATLPRLDARDKVLEAP